MIRMPSHSSNQDVWKYTMHDYFERPVQHLTSGQGQVIDQVGHVICQSIHRDETNDTASTHSALFNRELLSKKLLMTSGVLTFIKTR